MFAHESNSECLLNWRWPTVIGGARHRRRRERRTEKIEGRRIAEDFRKCILPINGKMEIYMQYVLVCNRWRLKNVLLIFQDNFLRIEQVLLSGRQKTKTLIYNSHQCIKKIETKIKIPNKHLNIEFTVKFYVQKSLKHKYNNTICE